MLLQVKDLIQIIVKFRTEKEYLCMFLSSTPNTNILNVVGHAQNIVHQILHGAVTLKRN